MSKYDFTGIAEWNRIEGWFDLAKAVAIQTYVKQLPRNATVVELGSFHGRSSVAIAAVLTEGSRLFCVDHFQGSAEHHEMDLDLAGMKQTFTRNIETFGVSDRIEILDATTLDAASRFESAAADLILLDAAHDYESVAADLRAWYPKLKPSGYLFCDDYDPRWPGVMQAVQERGLDGKLVAQALWLHQKPQSTA